MSVLLKEDVKSRRIRYGASGGGETLVFNGSGSDDSTEIYFAVLDIALGLPGGPIWDGFIRQDIEVQLLGGGRSTVTVEYGTVGIGGSDTPTGETPSDPSGPSSDTDALGAGFSWDLSAENVHITQSIKTISKTAIGGGAAPDNKQAIGLTKERVEGCDVFGPKFDWSRTVARESVNRAYLMQLRRLVGTKNNAPFYKAAAGEVLYLGSSGQWQQNKWSITHKFSERSNITNKFIVRDPDDPNNPAAPKALVVPSAKGWDYVWTAYENQVANNEVAPRPYAVYVEQVCEDGDFSLIGIGS